MTITAEPLTQGTLLGQYIRTRRRTLRMTQAQLAEASGIPQWTISRYEAGDAVRLPGAVDFAQLAHGLQVSQAEMLAAVGYVAAGVSA